MGERGAGWLAERRFITGPELRDGVVLHIGNKASTCGLRFVSVMEDQSQGQRIWGYEVRANLSSGQEALLFAGQSIGHRRILDCANADEFKPNVTNPAAALRNFAAFCDPSEASERIAFI